MKRFFLILAASGLMATAVYAQDWAKEDVLSVSGRWGGTFSNYPAGQPVPAAAPKGYKPFYISHMGRHGSRFIDGRDFYGKMLDIWQKADELGQLTPEGRKVLEAYSEIYPKLVYNEGYLTRKGQMQHRQIADQMVRNYPDLFKGRTRAEILSTDSHRVIMSMMCCMDELKTKDPDLQFNVNYGRPYYPVLVPESTSNPSFVPRTPFPQETLDIYEKFASEVFDQEAFLGKFFTSTEGVIPDTDDFLYNLMTMVAGFSGLDFEVPEVLTDMYTSEERYAVWRVQNYSDYLYTAKAPGIDIRRCLEMCVTAKDIIDRFEEDRANGVALRLRFSHDTALAPLMSYLGINGMDATIENPYDVEKVWRSYEICMASNIQIVFFSSRKNPDDILIQVLLNGFQATLPLPEAAPGFYHWSDFKEKFDRIVI